MFTTFLQARNSRASEISIIQEQKNREQAGACRGTECISLRCSTAFMFIVEKNNPERFCLNPWRQQIFSAVLTPASDLTVYTKYFLCMHSDRKREHRGLIFQCIVWGLRDVIHPAFRSNTSRSTCSFIMFTGMPWLHLRLVVVPVLSPTTCAIAKLVLGGQLLLLFTLT